MWIILTCLKIVSMGSVSFATNINPLTIREIENTEVTLQCRLPMNQSDGVNVYWYKKDEWITSGTTVREYDRQIRVHKPAKNEWNLYIRKAKLPFEDVYTCKTDVGKIISYNLIIMTPPKINESASSPKRITVGEGGSINLTCAVTGKPTPEIKWYRGKSETPIGISGQTLLIRNVTRYVTDEYLCRATNYITNAERIFDVTVTFSPEAEVKDSMVYVKEGEVTVMSCIVQGSPLVNYYWIDGKGNTIPTDEQNDKYYVEDEEVDSGIPARFLTLVFYKNMLGQRDYGNYTCVGAGKEDVARANVEIKGNT